MKRLRKLRLIVNQNSNIEETINSFRPPIFWKEKDRIKQQIEIWELGDIEEFIIELSNTETLIKRNPQISNQIMNNMIFEKLENVSILT